MLRVVCKLGRIVVLSDDRWAHILSHPEMRNQKRKMKEVLIDPDEVRASVHDSKVWLYYKLYPKTPVTTKFLLVIVKVIDGEGFIVTAFFTDKIKRGDLIWKKSL